MKVNMFFTAILSTTHFLHVYFCLFCDSALSMLAQS
jgi:hypothetical protein